ncbi:conserved hypothetical protein [Ignisphaera aggregans DSM 17230]|uniref:ArnR1-like winged helix-turn-helix domain-containing protein n=1 Tax=Ignisphaera aggregans (strain DSM 17230 / JCM 13409 / AQ1.S1) TaxID=583356 RepID=E0SSG0_IGNAA|nr:conserved hypothetical protein [Ignisphaera aggregans DSM 17230]
MNRKRNKLLIVMDILETLSRESIAPTRLAIHVNMPYDRLINILRELESKGLIKIVDGSHSRSVVLTDKGLKLLEELRRIKNILSEYGLL